LAAATARLRVLARAHLVESVGGHRFSLHALVRAYAVELAAQALLMPVREQARSRLLDYYRRAAAAAVAALGSSAGRRPDRPAARTPVPAFPDAAAARAWLHRERTTVIALWSMAADLGLT